MTKWKNGIIECEQNEKKGKEGAKNKTKRKIDTGSEDEKKRKKERRNIKREIKESKTEGKLDWENKQRWIEMEIFWVIYTIDVQIVRDWSCIYQNRNEQWM